MQVNEFIKKHSNKPLTSSQAANPNKSEIPTTSLAQRNLDTTKV